MKYIPLLKALCAISLNATGYFLTISLNLSLEMEYNSHPSIPALYISYIKV